MGFEKDIRFSEKKVDEGWKNEAIKETVRTSEEAQKKEPGKKPKPSKPFITIISSLGMQALIQLGEVEDPGTRLRSQDLAAARQTIDLLLALKEKTEGNLADDEARMLDGILYEIQMKFVALNPGA